MLSVSFSRLLGFAELDAEVVSRIKDLRSISVSVGYVLNLAVQKEFQA